MIAIIGCIGITHIIVLSSIFEPIRNFLSQNIPPLGKLISCTMCTGFWVGVFFGGYFGFSALQIILFGGAISFLSYFCYLVINLLSIIAERNENE